MIERFYEIHGYPNVSDGCHSLVQVSEIDPETLHVHLNSNEENVYVRESDVSGGDDELFPGCTALSFLNANKEILIEECIPCFAHNLSTGLWQLNFGVPALQEVVTAKIRRSASKRLLSLFPEAWRVYSYAAAEADFARIWWEFGISREQLCTRLSATAYIDDWEARNFLPLRRPVLYRQNRIEFSMRKLLVTSTRVGDTLGKHDMAPDLLFDIIRYHTFIALANYSRRKVEHTVADVRTVEDVRLLADYYAPVPF